MNEQPFFSVIIPTHKRSNLLGRSLASIKSQVGEIPCEVVVVSDVADKATDAVCQDLLDRTDIYVRRNGVPGPSESRNIGLSLAKGRYILFLDDDDAWHPELLSQLYGSAPVAGGAPLYFDCSVVKERRLPGKTETLDEAYVDLKGQLNELVYVKNRIPNCCFAFPRSSLDGILFDPSMRAYEDWDFVLSVMHRGAPRHVPVRGARIFEVDDDTTDRRGSSRHATDFNAVLDYLYVYRRHPAPTDALKRERSALLNLVGILVPPEML